MRKAANPFVIAMAGLLFVLAGCEQVGITGRRQLNFVPDSLINSMSLEQYGQFISQSKVITGTPEAEMVQRVGTRIENAVNEYSKEHSETDPFAGYKWEFNLVQDPNINAFAMPGGKVVVYTGILPVAKDDAGLATVIGHEIAHVYAKHGAERLSQSLIVEMGGVGLSTALKSQPETTKSLFNTAYSLGSQVGVLLPYSRLQESEADHLGVIFMAMAGYDPHAAVGFWERMAAASGGGKTPGFLSTHPTNEARIKNLQELIPEAMEYYKPAGQTTQTGLTTGQTGQAWQPGQK
ncbi:MAG: M48 family metallopeptidase [Solirubrobacterales bacterium]